MSSPISSTSIPDLPEPGGPNSVRASLKRTPTFCGIASRMSSVTSSVDISETSSGLR